MKPPCPMKYVHFLTALLGCLLLSANLQAQKAPEKTPQEERPLTKAEKRELEYQQYVQTVRKVSKMSREEKNTITECPLHNPGREMPLSDNYRANASDYTTCYEYPFAYQLNYRRYCKVCTRIMAKESGTQMPIISKGTFERCSIHNTPLKSNPDYDTMGYERNPDKSTPHARQYWFKYYCKTCTKIHKQTH